MSKVGWSGHQPTVKIGKINEEQAKYEAMWEHREYAEHSPGERMVYNFLSLSGAEPGDTVLDLGAGSGKASKLLKESGLDVTAIDFAVNCLDDDVDVPFISHDLTQPLELKAKYAFCCDVMEHIPEQDVDAVLQTVFSCADFAFLNISLTDESWGHAFIGETLHVCVKPPDWWKARIQKAGGKILHIEMPPNERFDNQYTHINVYVQCPTWKESENVLPKGRINTALEKIDENIAANVAAGWQQLTPHEEQDIEVMILAGGPSLNNFEDEIREKREAGMPLVTTNGAYNWCIEKGIKPISAQIVVDARPHNKRFVTPVVDDCKYLIASQCDPSLFEGLPHDRTFMWHSANSPETLKRIAEIEGKQPIGITGGSTVTLRAFSVLRALGFRKFHVYGMDSCFMGEGHAYEQPENDKDVRLAMKVNGSTFVCAPWMVYQAQEFMRFVKVPESDVEMIVYGDGLISTLIRHAAEL